MSTPFAESLAALAALSINGITHNYAPDALPARLERAQLPALLVLPLDVDQNATIRDGGDAFTAVAFADGLRTVQYAVTHLLLIAPANSQNGLRTHLPTLISAMDAYFAALRDDLRLGDTLLVPASVRVEPAIIPYNGVDYVACAFRHTWQVAV